MISKKQIRLVTLISGGIDSPVATYLMLNQGAEVTAVYFNIAPTSKNDNNIKLRRLIEQLEKVTKSQIKLFIVPFAATQKLIASKCNSHVICILCKRMMLRIAQKIGEQENATGLVMGDSLGQVASQTLQNLNVESRAIELPIIRPLIGLDKLEIVNISKEIGTYELSISPGAGCMVVPDKPTTNASLSRIETEEEKLNVQRIIDDTLKKIEIL